MDIFLLTIEPGLILVDLPVTSGLLIPALSFFFYMTVINFVLGVLKRIPFL